MIHSDEISGTEDIVPAACVMAKVFDVTPVPAIVTVEVRARLPLFSVADIVTTPLFEPEAGVTES